MNAMNKQVKMVARPSGYPTLSDFHVHEVPIPIPGPGQLLVKTHYLSVDPYQRGWMDQAQIGEIITGGVVGSIIQSRHPNFHQGEIVVGPIGWQEYGLSNGTDLRKIPETVSPVSKALGVLGITGLSAYFGMMEIGKPRPGETVVVSGAAGATGSIAGQIARIHGCRSIGIAGTDEKIDALINEFHFDSGFNYKTARDYDAILEKLCPDGIDIYFDNVGGTVTDAIFRHINKKARIIVCGQISQYNLEIPESGPRYLWSVLRTSSKIEGFVLSDFTPKFNDALEQLQTWISGTRLTDREQIAEGIESAPSAFIGVLKGNNIGKQLIRIIN